MSNKLIAVLLAFGLVASSSARSQELGVPMNDVLNLDATVSTEVAPDLAVITLAIVREGVDVAPLTKEVNEALARAFAEARAMPSVIASNGGYNTFPRYDSRGATSGPGTRTGWQVRAEIVLKSKDFNALGDLVGRLSQTLQIARSGFEISPDLREREGRTLLERGARAFQDKASAAARAFGYSGYSIKQVTIGSAGQSGGLRTMAYESRAAVAAPLPVESGQVTLTLSVNGSIQLRK